MKGNSKDNKVFERYGTQAFQEYMIQVLIGDVEVYQRTANIVEPDYFKGEAKTCIEYIKEYVSKNNQLPTPASIKAFTGVDIKPEPSPTESSKEANMNDIEGFCKFKAMINAITIGNDEVSKGNFTSIESLIRDALTVSLQKDLGTDYYEDPLTRNEILNSKQNSISTGWAELDKKLSGGFGYGELEIFAAPSGGGKSIFLQNLAMNMSVLNGLDVVYISLELSEELVANRIDCMMVEQSREKFKSNVEFYSHKIRNDYQNAGRMTIKRMPETTTRAADIRAYLKEYEIKFGKRPNVLCVDYIDLLGTDRADASDMFNKDKFVSEELRALAHEYNLLCISASQLNRGAVGSEDPTNANIAGGISKINTADNVIFIINNQMLRDRGEIQLKMAKTRNSGGVDQILTLNFETEYLKVKDPSNTLQNAIITPNTSSNTQTNNTASSQASINTSTPNNQSSAPTNTGNTPSIRQLLQGSKKS